MPLVYHNVLYVTPIKGGAGPIVLSYACHDASFEAGVTPGRPDLHEVLVSVELVKRAIDAFLKDPTPEVLCIEGRWGVGKTHAWDQAVQQSAADKRLAVTKYAKVSLFGIKDGADILQAVFANTMDLAVPDNRRRLPETIGNFKTSDVIKRLKSLPRFAADHTSIPYIAGLGGVARAILSNFVQGTLICLDDFERRASGVSINEVMGTIAQLRDEKKCKVVLILNENSLDESERAEFRRYSEKVINTAFQFLPSPEESSSIAFDAKDPTGLELKNACQELGIINIRVMKKIDKYGRALAQILKDADPIVVRDAVRSLVVLVWALISPRGEGAPTKEYITAKRRDQAFRLKKGNEYSSEETDWGLVLDKYGFNDCDEFDIAMIDGVEKGYFDEQRIGEVANKYLLNINKSRADRALEDAWKPFHDSFDNNSDEVASSIYIGCTENIKYLSPGNLSAAVSILKGVGRVDDATKLLLTYMNENGRSFKLEAEDFLFFFDKPDPDVKAAFDKLKLAREEILPTPVEAAARVYKGSWSLKDEKALAALTADDFARIIKELKGVDNSSFVQGCLEFRKISNVTKTQLEIVTKITSALIAIGRESPLNERRLRKFNIDLSSDAGTATILNADGK